VQRGSTLDETNEAKFLEIAYTFIPLLVNTRDDQAIFRGYAQVSSQVEPALALDQIKERVIDQLDKVIFDLDEDSPERLASITAYTLLNYREKKPMEWMPENVPSAQGDGAGEADAEAEVAVEVQQIEVVEQEPVEEVLTIINPTAGSGQTVVTGNPVKHQNITLLCTRGNDQTVAQLQPFAPLFGPEFFIGKTYEGRIQQASLCLLTFYMQKDCLFMKLSLYMQIINGKLFSEARMTLTPLFLAIQDKLSLQQHPWWLSARQVRFPSQTMSNLEI
jgi:hypothetical protein